MKRGAVFLAVAILLVLLAGFQTQAEGAWEQMAVFEAAGVTVAGFYDNSFGITVDSGGIIQYSEDGGKKWQKSTTDPAIYTLYGLEIIDRRTVWSCGVQKQVHFSNDSGKTWTRAADYGAAYSFNAFTSSDHCRFLSFLNNQSGWIGAQYKLAATSDGGKSWSELALPAGIRIGAIARCNPETGFLFDWREAGTLYTTRDGGKSWTAQKTGMKTESVPPESSYSIPLAAMRFSDPLHGIVAVNRKGGEIWILTTADGGKSWSQELAAKKFGALFLSPDGRFLTITGMYGDVTVLKRK
jgi:photosystem II stability/assembly factor-like uncharacterized protein